MYIKCENNLEHVYMTTSNNLFVLYTTILELFPTQWQTNFVCERSFYNIMSDQNKRNIVKLSKYLYKAFE